MLKKMPFIISVVGILGGIIIAIMFGANEHYFKDKIANDLKSNPAIVKMNNEQQSKFMAKEKSKNWRYFQRYHFHSVSIGTTALVLLILLQFITACSKTKLISSFLISVGGFLYPFFWLFAAIYGPSMGRSVAKENAALLGHSGGLFLLGTIICLFLLTFNKLKFKEE